MEKELCDLKHKLHDDRHEVHEKRLNAHAEQIDELKVSDARNTNEITNLCKQISDLVKTVQWLIGLLLAGYFGYFCNSFLK